MTESCADPRTITHRQLYTRGTRSLRVRTCRQPIWVGGLAQPDTVSRVAFVGTVDINLHTTNSFTPTDGGGPEVGRQTNTVRSRRRVLTVVRYGSTFVPPYLVHTPYVLGTVQCDQRVGGSARGAGGLSTVGRRRCAWCRPVSVACSVYLHSPVITEERETWAGRANSCAWPRAVHRSIRLAVHRPPEHLAHGQQRWTCGLAATFVCEPVGKWLKRWLNDLGLSVSIRLAPRPALNCRHHDFRGGGLCGLIIFRLARTSSMPPIDADLELIIILLPPTPRPFFGSSRPSTAASRSSCAARGRHEQSAPVC